MAAIEKKNLHVPLPAELHADLKEQASHLGRPATAVARDAIEEWIRERKRERIAVELRAYATRMAGTGADLDAELEAAGVENSMENVP